LAFGVIRYLNTTKSFGLVYRPPEKDDYEDEWRTSFYNEMRERKNYEPYYNDPTKLVLHAYGDASFAPTATEKSYDDGVGRSVTGVVVQCCGGTLSWTSKRQSITTASTAESETLAQMTASYHALGLRDLLLSLRLPLTVRTHNDNQASMSIIACKVPSSKTRHLIIKTGVVRDLLLTSEVDGDYCPSDKQKADPLTKSLSREKHTQALKLLSMRERERKALHQP